MELIIENKKDGTSFELIIMYASTVLDIKQRIHDEHGVPVNKQTLYSGGVALENDQYIMNYQVFDGSKIQLVIHQDDQEEKQEGLVMMGGDEVMAMEEMFGQQEGLVMGGDELTALEDIFGNQEGLVMGSDDQVMSLKDIFGEQEGLVMGGNEVMALKDVVGQQEGLFMGGASSKQGLGTMGNVDFGQQQGLGTVGNVDFGQQQGLVGGHEGVVVQDDVHHEVIGVDDDHHRKGKEKIITFKITVRLPPMRKLVEFDMEGGETVAQLQQMIDFKDMAVGRIALVAEGVLMRDAQRTLAEYGVVEGTELVARFMITLKVLVHGPKEKIDVEMDMIDRVSVLRKQLERLKNYQRLEMPDGDYFFKHKEAKMQEGKSFQWHFVEHGDTIDVVYVND